MEEKDIMELKNIIGKLDSKVLYILGNIINLLTFLGLIYINFSSADIWADEACTIQTVRHGFLSITQLTGIDVHPPLYYYIVKLFCCLVPLSDEIMIGRIVSLLPYVILWFVAAKYVVNKIGGLGIILPVCICQFYPIVSNFNEIRMYSWGMLFVTLAALLGVDISEDSSKSHWAGLIILSLAAAYTHYFALVAVFWVWIICELSNIRSFTFLKKWIIAGCLVFIGYLPWLFVLLRQTQEVFTNYWIKDINFETIKNYFWYIYSTNVPYVAKLSYMFILILLFYHIKKYKNIKIFQAGGYVLLPFIVIFCGVVISKIFRPVFMYRYIVPSLGTMAVGEILLIKNLQEKSKRCEPFLNTAVLVMFVIIVSLNLRQSIIKEKYYGASWNNLISAIEYIKKDRKATFIYIENGQPLVRPFTVLWEDDTHLCENVNMSLYNQRLFGTKAYVGQKVYGPVFIVVNVDNEIRKYEKYLGVLCTSNGDYKVYYDCGGYQNNN
ncbi:glycosyltransferase family 39 protein [Enterocloster bolteae]|jgi:uncharacterized membrane protein|nr:glycosyltransferase family 39 protein [Enterocloster bolteae]MCB6928848.1 glycosyltransferase family 39 protein [Enterocloster bolteae]MCG4903171.1 glycosyltransferase family 39 protein [Enterocloster bolteae]MCQ4758413.1 glycosyltransferase family 39 protein [Enterocloster bolteae]MDU3288155.1 glycosyltransferase family 39 protein [Enterocloster bolteae]